MAERGTVVIAQGHLYLFWTAGIYYTNELVQNYDVVLVVPDNYQANKKFVDVCQQMKIGDIYYFEPRRRNAFSFHYKLSTLFRKIIKKHKPVAVVQQDYLGIENMYLFHWSKKLFSSCRNVVMLSCMPSSVNTMVGFKQFREYNVETLAKRLFLSRKLVGIGVSWLKYLQSFINNKLIPMILLRERPYFPISLFSNIDIVPNRPLFDFFLIYNRYEKEYLQNLFQSKDLFQIIDSPIRDRFAINNVVYDVKPKKQIAFFPSLIAIKSFVDEKKVIDKWILALGILRRKYPDYEFIMKFHPGCQGENLDKLKRYLKVSCAFLSFIEGDVTAEELMLNSEVVVGDVSSTLWWANNRGDKLVISLDMQNSLWSANMKPYSTIVYVDNMLSLEDLNVERKASVEKLDDRVNNSTSDSLLEFLESVLAQ